MVFYTSGLIVCLADCYICQFTQECIDEYDQNEKEKEAPDFLTFLRVEEKKNKEGMPHRDLINHLSNNL